jgi:hypothetical protein
VEARNAQSALVADLSQPVAADYFAVRTALSVPGTKIIRSQHSPFIFERCIGQAREAIDALGIVEMNLIFACGAQENTQFSFTSFGARKS